MLLFILFYFLINWNLTKAGFFGFSSRNNYVLGNLGEILVGMKPYVYAYWNSSNSFYVAVERVDLSCFTLSVLILFLCPYSPCGIKLILTNLTHLLCMLSKGHEHEYLFHQHIAYRHSSQVTPAIYHYLFSPWCNLNMIVHNSCFAFMNELLGKYLHFNTRYNKVSILWISHHFFLAKRTNLKSLIIWGL